MSKELDWCNAVDKAEEIVDSWERLFLHAIPQMAPRVALIEAIAVRLVESSQEKAP